MVLPFGLVGLPNPPDIYLFFLVAPTILAVFVGLWYKAQIPQPELLSILDTLHMQPPASYRAPKTTTFQSYHRIGLDQGFNLSSVPNVSAVILNWSRFQNVVSIVSVLCSHSLDDIISDIVVWNNNPRPLSHNNFRSAACEPAKLKIINSPENVYFQARFIACAGSQSPYCFIQDDDYLVRPEIIRTLHSRIVSSGNLGSIHLLPPHEYLSSRSLSVFSTDGAVHTSFAWLGHGAIIHRPLSSAFLSLMETLGFSEEEKKMADNYFTILHNEVVEVWLDRGMELGGGQPFTVGNEGEQRNRKHIHRATEYLDEIISSGKKYEYVSSKHGFPFNPVDYAACVGTPCLLSTDIAMLDRSFTHSVSDPTQLLVVGLRNLNSLRTDDKEWISSHSLSHAIDGDVATYFMSPHSAKINDSIMLDMTTPIDRQWCNIEMVLVVNPVTAGILTRCDFDSSVDSLSWMSSSDSLTCHSLPDTTTPGVGYGLFECSVRFSDGYTTAQYFRLRLVSNSNTAVEERWVIYEIWMRGKKRNKH